VVEVEKAYMAVVKEAVDYTAAGAKADVKVAAEMAEAVGLEEGTEEALEAAMVEVDWEAARAA
jgi:hypothetical protein